jgi:hypothetical protein
MAKGNSIIVSSEPKGVREECIISGTPTPGVVMELKGATAAVGGRFTYEPAGTTAAAGSKGMSADGDRIPICVLTEDSLQGKLATTAYADGDRGFLYWPVNGEELNMLFQNASGTADDVLVGDKLIVDDGTGKLLVSTGSPECEPFGALEAITDPTVDQLFWVKYTGN